jgi:hypothetical protein
LYSYCGCTYVADGNAYTTGNVQTVAGESGTFAQGLNYGYLYMEMPDSYVDVIEGNGGTIFFRDQGGLGRAVYSSGPSNGYRTIHAAVTFGALRNTDSERQQLALAMVHYLGELTGIGGEPRGGSRSAELAAFPNPAGRQVTFACNVSTPGRLEVFDAVGKLVNEWTVSGSGQPVAITWNARDRSGRNLAPGCYVMRLSSGAGVVTKRLVIVE